MTWPSGTFLEFLRWTTREVGEEFTRLYAQFQGWLEVEHLEDGSHGDIVCDSCTIRDGGTLTGAAPPERAVQFNTAGAFDGSEWFTFNDETQSVICGLDSTITAADHESCQAFGSNCHIAD